MSYLGIAGKLPAIVAKFFAHPQHDQRQRHAVLRVTGDDLARHTESDHGNLWYEHPPGWTPHE